VLTSILDPNKLVTWRATRRRLLNALSAGLEAGQVYGQISDDAEHNIDSRENETYQRD
jgi:hypothetical protein